MPSYDFALILSRPFYEEELDPLFDRTRGDVTVSIVTEPQHADRPGNASCSWSARTLAAAIMDVVAHVEESAPGARVLRVEADPLLTMRDIADRTGRSIDSVRLSITGARGSARGLGRSPDERFPAAEMATGGHRLWRWSKVAAWYGVEDPVLREARPTARAINGWLALRDVVPDIAPAADDVTTALSAVVHVA
ncbi:hypothetical protein BTM25_40090 [Actinomadura rubteroloni]|uniref:DNA-binding protein n=1 Tax=Actinomadura rubteroloni TaxID=1926885 RepID=A0A2P4UJX8_9ACTN|nr:hypothetical protein [Actinomadura rubteroloni]POM25365.1 hypothetical protein BTM25_40090 [Actinomadura rubteroloni]